MLTLKAAIFGRFRSPTLAAIATLAASEGAARSLSFLYYLLAARLLAPAGFGTLQYTIAVASIAFGALQVLAMVTNRELGAARANPARSGEVIATTVVVAVVLWLASLTLCVGALGTGLIRGANPIGLLAVLTGLALFQMYYAIARGVGDVKRAALTYIGGSLAQLVAFAILAVAAHPSPAAALVIFGASAAVPIVGCEIARPLVRGRRLVAKRAVLRQLWTLGSPVLMAQIAFLVWQRFDQIWVEGTLGLRETGLYGAAKTLSQIYLVIPAGVVGVVLPRVAELSARGEYIRARRVAYMATAVSVAASAALAVVVVLVRDDLLGRLYGPVYGAAAPSILGLTAAGILYAAFAPLSASAIGWGRPSVFTVGVTVATVAQFGYLVLFPSGHASTAAWAQAASTGVGLAGVMALLRARPVGEAK